MEVKELLLVRNVWLFPATNLHFFHPKLRWGSATRAQGTAKAPMGSNNRWIRVDGGILATLGILMTSENIFFPSDTAASGFGSPRGQRSPGVCRVSYGKRCYFPLLSSHCFRNALINVIVFYICSSWKGPSPFPACSRELPIPKPIPGVREPRNS